MVADEIFGTDLFINNRGTPPMKIIVHAPALKAMYPHS